MLARLVRRHPNQGYRPWHLCVNVLAASGLVTHEIRARLYRLGGLRIATLSVRPGCYFLNADVMIGEGCMIGQDCHFDSTAPIVLGRNVYMAAQCMVGTSSHSIGGPEQRAGEGTVAAATIGDGTWLGTRVTILPGVTVGRGCVIAAGSVVTEDCAPDGLYAGVPAIRKRHI